MKFRTGAVFAGVLLASCAVWPFWQAQTRGHGVLPAPETLPPAEISTGSGAGGGTAAAGPVCSGCGDLRRLARRLRAREEGAARRVEAASVRLSAQTAAAGTALELALRRARDDKRGAAAFRTAILEAVRLCEGGAGCGETVLSDYWVENCPPEHPDLGREAGIVAALGHALAAKASACAFAVCPEISCERQARAAGLLAAADRTLQGLAETAGGEPAPASPGGRTQAADLLKAAEEWRNRIPALFLGGADPSAQMTAAADAAAELAAKLAGVRAPGGRDSLWRLNVLSIRLEATAETLNALAAAGAANGGGRDAAMLAARRRAADAFRDLLVTQMRLRSAGEGAAQADAATAQRCGRRRRAQIARARGQIRALRAALGRCGRRAVCPARAGRAEEPPLSAGLDPVPARRLALDSTLMALSGLAHDLTVTAQEPVAIATNRSRYQGGEAVFTRINARATACMADEGSWVGLFPAAAPPLRAAETGATALRRLELRGRPWEEVLFEAPGPGAWEVRTFAAARRGGGITGRARFEVTPRAEGCNGFTGTWKTNFGRLRITVRGSEASGSYRRSGAWRAGFLTGRVKGRVLAGEWQSELGAGGTRLVLSEDGRTLSGTWSQFRDFTAGTGIWKGTCEGPVRRQSRKGGDGN